MQPPALSPVSTYLLGSNIVTTTNLVPVSLWSQQQTQPPFGGHRHPKCISDWRPASSVYLDDHQLNGIAHLYPQSTVMYPYTSGSGAALEPVSPPSSPEPFDGNNEYMDYDVSPIDDEPDVFQRQLEANQPPTQPSSQAPRGVHTQLTEDDDYQQQPTQVISGPRSGIGKTSIPTMRRERRKQRDAAHAQANKDHRHSPRPGDEPLPKPSQPMGWDDPTNLKSVAQAGPPERAPKFGTTTTVMSGSQDRRQASNPNTASFGQRMRHQFGRGKAEPIQNRPAWNGASGRETQVSPVRDDLNAAPLKIPPKSAKRNERVRTPVNLPVTDINEGASAAATAAVRRLMPIKTAPAADRSRGNSPAFETPKSGVPITPQAYANAKPTQIAASPQQWPPRDSSMSTPSAPTAPSNLGVPGQFNIKESRSVIPELLHMLPNSLPQALFIRTIR
ncbi:hypothetical protein V2G26_014518 [Clonostachys chloroleuca]